MNVRPVPTLRRTADIVFTARRIAVFVDGCYWHGCPEHYVASRSNRDYWDKKIAGNVARDSETNDVLTKSGWIVLRFWSHTPAEEMARCIWSTVSGVPQTTGSSED